MRTVSRMVNSDFRRCRIAVHAILSESLPEEKIGKRLDEAQEIEDKYRKAIDILPMHERKILKYSFFYGHTHSEIGRMMGVTERSIAYTLHKALNTIAEIMAA